MSDLTHIGIDIGTTHSRVAIFKEGRPQVIANELANNLTPSYVAYTDKLCHVGDRAKHQAAMNVSNTIYGVRRMLGRGFDDPIVQKDRENKPYKIDSYQNRPKIQVLYKDKPHTVTLEESMALLIEKMVDLGANALNQKITKAVITVPSQFTCCQRRAVKDAADIVGIESELINETTAAAVAYAFEKKSEFVNRTRNLLVYNMGGGFTTATIVRIRDKNMEVLATAGDMHLGGDDFDQVLVDHCCQQVLDDHNRDLRQDPRALCRLRRACEKAKRELSFSLQNTIDFEDICTDKDFEMLITRVLFQAWCEDLFKRTMFPVEKALSDAELKAPQIDDIILVGGSTRIPRIQQQLRSMFSNKDVNLSVNQDEAAALGTAVQIAEGINFQDVVPEAFGIHKFDGEVDFIYKRGSSFPCTRYAYMHSPFNVHMSMVLVKVMQGRHVILGQRNFIKEVVGNTMRLDFNVDTDGILTVTADIAGNPYQFELKSDKSRLTDYEISTISEELANYKRHRSEDSERILAKGAREDLLDCRERVITKYEREVASEHLKNKYKIILEELNEWIQMNASATSAEYENMLTKVKATVAKVEEQRRSVGIVNNRKEGATRGQDRTEKIIEKKKKKELSFP